MSSMSNVLGLWQRPPTSTFQFFVSKPAEAAATPFLFVVNS